MTFNWFNQRSYRQCVNRLIGCSVVRLFGYSVHRFIGSSVHRFSKSRKAFGLIETILAVGIFAIIAATGVSTIVYTFQTNRLGSEETNAAAFAQEGIEAMRSIRNQGWSDLFLTPAATNNCAGGCGVTVTEGKWTLKNGIDTSGKFTSGASLQTPLYH